MTGQNIGHVRADKPPSQHAWSVLAAVRRQAFPAQEMNFTVRDKLRQHGYITIELRPSPYQTHKPGMRADFAVITEAGIAALEARK